MTTISEHDIQACPLKSRIGAPKAQDYSDAILTLSFNLLSPEDQRQVMAKCMPGVAFRSTVNSRDVTFNVSYALHALHRWTFMSEAFGKLIKLAEAKRFRWLRLHPDGAALYGWELHERKSVRSVGWSLARPLVRFLFWIVDGAWLGFKSRTYRQQAVKDEARVAAVVERALNWSTAYQETIYMQALQDTDPILYRLVADRLVDRRANAKAAEQELAGLRANYDKVLASTKLMVQTDDTSHIQKV